MIEDEVNQLGSDMERMKEILGKKITQINMIDISAVIPDIKHTIIRELEIKLDGYTIYKMDPHVGLWQIRSMIFIYSGSLKQGDHNSKYQQEFPKLYLPNYRLKIKSLVLLIRTIKSKYQKGNLQKIIRSI